MAKVKTAAAQILKQDRKRIHMTQAAYAKHLGVGLHFIRDVEQGKETISLKKLNEVLAKCSHVMHPCRVLSLRPYTPPMKKIKLKDIDDPEKTRRDKDAVLFNL